MLLIVLPAVWFAVVLVTLVMLRMVALSDREHDLAVAGWLTQGHLVLDDPHAAAATIDPPRDSDGRGEFRATG
jgi:hypothetical protein